MDQEPNIVLETPQPGITVVRLNRPARMNTLLQEQVVALHGVFDRLSADTACRVIILTGTGRGFCTGTDLQASVQRQQANGRDPLTVKMQYQENFGLMAKHIRTMRQPLIAAVNGAAVGAGMALALAADVRLAARSARFLNGAVRIGLSGGEAGMSYHLPRLIGAARAFELMLTGRPVEADEAERIGLVSQVVDDERLMDTALALAEQMAQNSPYSLQHTKRVMWTNLDAPSLDAALDLENRAQILATMTDDFHEAARAFTEKRKPVFTGR